MHEVIAVTITSQRKSKRKIMGTVCPIKIENHTTANCADGAANGARGASAHGSPSTKAEGADFCSTGFSKVRDLLEDP